MNQQQGTIFSKIAMPIVIVAIVVYLICSAWVGIRDPYQFTVAYTDTMETSVDAAGWVVRSEQPVAGRGRVWSSSSGPGREGGQGQGDCRGLPGRDLCGEPGGAAPGEK